MNRDSRQIIIWVLSFAFLWQSGLIAEAKKFWDKIVTSIEWIWNRIKNLDWRTILSLMLTALVTYTLKGAIVGLASVIGGGAILTGIVAIGVIAPVFATSLYLVNGAADMAGLPKYDGPEIQGYTENQSNVQTTPKKKLTTYYTSQDPIIPKGNTIIINDTRGLPPLRNDTE